MDFKTGEKVMPVTNFNGSGEPKINQTYIVDNVHANGNLISLSGFDGTFMARNFKRVKTVKMNLRK